VRGTGSSGSLQEIEDRIPDPVAGLLDRPAIRETPLNRGHLGDNNVLGLPIDHLMVFNVLAGNGGGDGHVKKV
jgi:hypothetical protein